MGSVMMPFRSDVGRHAAALPDALARIDDEGRLLWRNDEWFRLVEVNGPSDLGRPLADLVPDEDRPKVEVVMAESSAGARVGQVRVRIRLADGTRPPTELTMLRAPAHGAKPAFTTALLRLVDGA